MPGKLDSTENPRLFKKCPTHLKTLKTHRKDPYDTPNAPQQRRIACKSSWAIAVEPEHDKGTIWVPKLLQNAEAEGSIRKVDR